MTKSLLFGNKLKDLFKNDVTIELVFNMDLLDKRDILLGNYPLPNCISFERGGGQGYKEPYTGRVWVGSDSIEPGIIDSNSNLHLFFKGKTQNYIISFDRKMNRVAFGYNGILLENIDEIYKNTDKKNDNKNIEFNNTWIGRDNREDRKNTQFNGKLYSVRIYNRILSNEELISNYNVDKKRFNF